MEHNRNTDSQKNFEQKIQEVIKPEANNNGDVELLSDEKTKSNQQDELLLLNQSLTHDLPSTSMSSNGETNFNTSVLEALSTLATTVRGIRDDISHLNKKFDIIIQNTNIDTDIRSPLFLDDYWPWTSEEQMIEAEASMKEDQTQFKRVIMMLKRIGGIDSISCVVNILKTTMVNDVAVLYSWAGKKKKKSFLDTFPTFVKVISVVSRYHNISITDEDIKQNVSRWLKQAPLRCSRAILKRKRTEDDDYDEDSYDELSS